MKSPITARWTFTWHDREWFARRNPPASENLELAVETLIIPFGQRWQSVENFIVVWRKMEQEHGTEYSPSTPGAVAERISRDTVEICDLYDQFTDVRLPADEFVNLLAELLATMQNQ